MSEPPIVKTPRFVTPDGSLLVQPVKGGLLMGNRGKLGPVLHTLPQPHAASKPWITCILEENGVPLAKTSVSYTKLFFLDEVTAFAAGHRPCGQCQPERYKLFAKACLAAHGDSVASVDDVLQRDRCNQDGSKKTFPSVLGDLPSGVMIRLPESGQPALLLGKRLFPWTKSGYGQPAEISQQTTVQVLTPRVIVKMFSEGFPLEMNCAVTVHASVLPFLEEDGDSPRNFHH